MARRRPAPRACRLRPPVSLRTRLSRPGRRRARLHMGRIEPWRGQAPSDGRDRKAFARSSISARSRPTRVPDMPPAPMALTGSSTERVETPWTWASRITATRAVPALRRGSGTPGERPPFRSPGDLRRDPPGARIPVAAPFAVALDLPHLRARAPGRPGSAPRPPKGARPRAPASRARGLHRPSPGNRSPGRISSPTQSRPARSAPCRRRSSSSALSVPGLAPRTLSEDRR